MPSRPNPSSKNDPGEWQVQKFYDTAYSRFPHQKSKPVGR
jgi:hypothetical protein